MMRYFLYIVTVITSLLYFSSCNSTKTVGDNDVYGAAYVTPSVVHTLKPDTLSKLQIDSVVRTDNLPVFNSWKRSVFKDNETNLNSEYRTVYDYQTGIIYTVKTYNNKYILFKKYVKND